MPRTAVNGALVALVSLTTIACNEASDDTEHGESEDRDVTYYEDILPILSDHCVSCHSEDGLAPFAVDDYETAKEWAMSMGAAVTSRTMPPFGVDNGGECNEFVDARWLEVDEIAMINAWVATGTLEGDPTVGIPDPPTPPVLAGDDIVEVITPSYTPVPEAEGGGLEDYQCFLLDLNQDRERYVVGFDVIPGNDRTVHHVLGFKVNPNIFGNGDTMQALDDASPDQLGWDCFGAAGENVIPEGVPVTWAPGTGATLFPEGTGIPMRDDDVLVVQVHYNLANENGPDATTIRLSYADEVERPAVQVLWDPFLYASVLGSPEFIEAGKESVSYTWDDTIRTMTNIQDAESVQVYGLLPHMHKRGRTMTIDFETNAGMACGARVDRWDFNWQQSFFLEQPLTVGIDDSMHVTCNWNTMQDTAPIAGGFGTKDEMCLVGLYVVPQ
jgi:hypothetical protein